MEFKKAGRHFIIRLYKGEEIISSLTGFCKEHKITAGVLQGIGAVLEAELAFYELDKKKYLTKKVKGPLELLSLKGNVSMVKGGHFIHCHAVLSGRDMEAIGGHLKSGVVAATCEIVLAPLDTRLERSEDREIGLNLLKL